MAPHIYSIKSFASVELRVDKGHGVDLGEGIFKHIYHLVIICPHDSHVKQAGDHLKVVLDPVVDLFQEDFFFFKGLLEFLLCPLLMGYISCRSIGTKKFLILC